MKSTASLISTYTCFPGPSISDTAIHGNLEVLGKSTSRQRLPFGGWEEAETTQMQPCSTLLVSKSQSFLQKHGIR